MAIEVNTELDLRITSVEKNAVDLGTAKLTHSWSVVQTLANGTGAAQNDRVWSDKRTLVGAVDSLDLLGTLTSQLTGAVVNFVDVYGYAIKNNATTTAYKLTIGGGANAFTKIGSTREIGPGGFDLWGYGNVDSASPVAATGDILTVDPGANTVEYEIIIWGRSA